MPDDQKNLPAQHVNPGINPMKIWEDIVGMAHEKEIDAGKIGLLLGHQITMMDYASKTAFTAAKNAAMMEMPVIMKDSMIVHNGKLIGKYTKYEDLRRVIDPILNRHYLRITHRPGFNDAMKMPTVEALLNFARDNMTYTEECGPMPLPFDTGGAKSATQGAGSSLQYGMRYTTCAALGIVQEGIDNDASSKTEKQGDEKWQTPLLEEAMMIAKRGSKAYAAWYASLSGMKKGWLYDQKEHEAYKKAAAEMDNL
jgi:hypothetical protein